MFPTLQHGKRGKTNVLIINHNNNNSHNRVTIRRRMIHLVY